MESHQPAAPNEIVLTPEQEAGFDRLVDGGFNAIEARYMLGVGATKDIVELYHLPATEEGMPPKAPLPQITRVPQRARTSREKAWADTRADLKPFPYGTVEE